VAAGALGILREALQGAAAAQQPPGSSSNGGNGCVA
jgi:hypothetical protein